MSEEYRRNGTNPEDNDFVYKAVMEGKRKSRAWSVASLAVSVVSLICCCSHWVGAVLGAIAIVFAIISRRSIGYFDGLAIAGLIVGIFGVVFGVAGYIFLYTLETSEYFEEFLRELEKQYPEMGNINNSL